MSTGCGGTSRAGNPCGRTPGPGGYCPDHADSPTSTPAAPSTPSTAAPANAAPANPAWGSADHQHVYSLSGQCTHDGCDRERPAWLIGHEAPSSPARARDGLLRPATPTTVGGRILAGIVSLFLITALLNGVGHYVTNQVAEPVGTGSSLVQP